MPGSGGRSSKVPTPLGRRPSKAVCCWPCWMRCGGRRSARVYLAFELVALEGLSGGEAGRLTGLSRNAVYKANQRVLQRLKDLGAPYREEGRLGEQIKQALEARPPAAVQRSVSVRIQQTMYSR